MVQNRYPREGLRQLQEMYQRLTLGEIAQRGRAQGVSEEIKKLQKIAAQRVLRRREIFPQM